MDTLSGKEGRAYAKINGNDGVVLSIEKQPTYATADVAESILIFWYTRYR